MGLCLQSRKDVVFLSTIVCGLILGRSKRGDTLLEILLCLMIPISRLLPVVFSLAVIVPGPIDPCLSMIISLSPSFEAKS